MNLFANAIDALEESNHGRRFEDIQLNCNRIKITTSLEDNCIKIIIADNGKGINESIKQKIFDHLFTTKGVGKGTGLGLAIARQIIEETHNGKLSFNTVVGEGYRIYHENTSLKKNTEFRIQNYESRCDARSSLRDAARSKRLPPALSKTRFPLVIQNSG